MLATPYHLAGHEIAQGTDYLQTSVFDAVAHDVAPLAVSSLMRWILPSL